MGKLILIRHGRTDLNRPGKEERLRAWKDIPLDSCGMQEAEETARQLADQRINVIYCGIIVNVTPFEPEWEGFVTLEISNTTPLPARIYANEGLCQILFFESDEVCEVSYADRKGKYQSQQGIVLPKL